MRIKLDGSRGALHYAEYLARRASEWVVEQSAISPPVRNGRYVKLSEIDAIALSRTRDTNRVNIIPPFHPNKDGMRKCDPGGDCGVMRWWGGELPADAEVIEYTTHTGLGVYTIDLGVETVEFEGQRQSFRDGCEPFDSLYHPRTPYGYGPFPVSYDMEDWMEPVLEYETSEPDWAPWETEYSRAQDGEEVEE